MKRFTVLLTMLLIWVAAFAPAKVYAASPVYARAAVRDAYFFKEKDNTTAQFAVPYTYCIEILRDEGDWYYARYASDAGLYKALYGYCKKENFTRESGAPQVTFLYKTVTVKYKVEDSSSSLPVLGEIAVEAAYYGTYYSGATVYSYVYCQGTFGYIEGANDDYPLNEPAQKPDGDEKNDGASGGKSGLNFATIVFVVIAVLFALVILIIYFATRKPKIDG